MPYLALVVCTVIWGATFPATKLVLEQTPPFTFLFLRFAIGTLLVVGYFVLVTGARTIDTASLRTSAVTTVFLFIGYAAQTVGLQETSASNSAFITALYVVFVPLYLRRFDGRVWLSAGLALVGLWFLVNPVVTVNRGDLWTLVCAAGFAGHITCVESFARVGQAPSFFAWQLFLMTLVLVPATAMESPSHATLAPTQALFLALIICGVLATGALGLQIWGQRSIPAQQAALIFVLEPVFAALMAWWFLDEQLEARAWLGCSLILVAVCLGSLIRSPEKKSGGSSAQFG